MAFRKRRATLQTPGTPPMSHMQPTILSLKCPKLRAALGDLGMTQRWEVLRRSTKPLTAHELAEACGVSDGIAQRSLDLLVEAGLVVRIRASARRREITYQPASERVLVEWDSDSDSDLGFLLQLRQAVRAYSRSVIDRNDTPETRGMPGLPKFRGIQSFSFTRDEAESIAQTLRSAWAFVTRVEMQARERAAAARSGSAVRKDKGGDAAAAEDIPYHLAMEFRPLKQAELPLSDIGTWEKRTLARELAYLSSAPASVLTQREQEIARRLAAGESRPQVAKALGLTANTIASATKRMYAKLGVRSRAEFVSRMKSG